MSEFDQKLAELREWRVTEAKKKTGLSPKRRVERYHASMKKLGRTDGLQWKAVLLHGVDTWEVQELAEDMMLAARRLLLRALELKGGQDGERVDPAPVQNHTQTGG